MLFEEAISGIDIPHSIKLSLALIRVPYCSFENQILIGELIVHKDLADETVGIFKEIADVNFPIMKVIPISYYNWSDENSMADNNTSCFNYRKIYGTSKFSQHAYGRAVDINPLFNPYIAKDGSVHPKGAYYDISRLGTITEESGIVNVFEKRNWIWGGRWQDRKDWQHFEKA